MSSYRDRIKQKRSESPVEVVERPESYDDVTDDMFLNQLQDAQAKINSLTTSGSGEIIFGSIRADAAGLHIGNDITPDELHLTAEMLFKLEGRIQLFIGDLLNAAEKLQYGDIKHFADTYGIEHLTLINWKSLASSVEISLRSDILAENPDKKALTKSHYELVRSFDEDEQYQWLSQAASNEWSVARFRDAIRASHGRDESPTISAFARFQQRFQKAFKHTDQLSDSDKLKAIALLQQQIERLKNS